MNSAAAGKRAEAKVKEHLTADGYRILTAHLSRGPADIMAGKPFQVLAVQVKRSARSGGGVGPAEWNELLDFARDFQAVPLIAFASPRSEVRFMRLTGRKDGSKRRQPWEPWPTSEPERRRDRRERAA